MYVISCVDTTQQVRAQTYYGGGADNEGICNLWFILKTVIKIYVINVTNITLFATAFVYVYI